MNNPEGVAHDQAVAGNPAVRINRCHIGGAWVETPTVVEANDLYRGAAYARTHMLGEGDVEAVMQAARRGADAMERAPAHKRAAWIEAIAAGLRNRAEEAARMLVAEAGKPISVARDEVRRSVETLRLSAAEALKIAGAGVPLDASARGEGRLGFYIRVPVGVVLGITPFNAPLNLLAHKLGPALAGGNAFIAKPDPRTPSTATLLWEIIDSLDLPPGAAQLAHGGPEVGSLMVADERVDFVSFTGGAIAAAAIVRQAGLKRVALELGGNAANIICADADLAKAADQIVVNAFGHAGQSCIGVQRVYVEAAVIDAFRDLVVARTKAAKQGDPMLEDTLLGPMINQSTVSRLRDWIAEARAGGARLLTGGQAPDGVTLEPTILEGAMPGLKVVCEEIFGPIMVLQSVADLDEAIAHANDSRFGMQAGIFTGSLANALTAVRRLKVGGVVVNGTSNYRVDNQPYGGIRQSGTGREGPAYAILEMTEIRMVVLQ